MHLSLAGEGKTALRPPCVRKKRELCISPCEGEERALHLPLRGGEAIELCIGLCEGEVQVLCRTAEDYGWEMSSTPRATSPACIAAKASLISLSAKRLETRPVRSSLPWR